MPLKEEDENSFQRFLCTGPQKNLISNACRRSGSHFASQRTDTKSLLEEHIAELTSLQQLHYASNRYALLLIFQGMDSAGKDGAIRHVMSGVNPEGCEVFSFKQPSAEELEHDFLWRTTCRLPERGRIGIFNRSYYEEVLIVRVHPEILRTQRLPEELLDEKNIWKERYRSIVDLEHHLYRNGTRIVKIFLNLSYEEQRKRFLARIEEPDKNWKVSSSDNHERKYWKHYMEAYEDCLNATSTRHAPWYAVPADDKDNARLIVSRIVLDTLQDLKMALGATLPGRGVTSGKALAMEVVLTTGLVNTILGTAYGARNVGANGAIAVGGYIALACNSATPTTVAARNSTQLTAAGSSFVYPVMMRWVQAYGQGHQGLQINYQSIGSGGGIEQLKNGWWTSAPPTLRSMTKR